MNSTPTIRVSIGDRAFVACDFDNGDFCAKFGATHVPSKRRNSNVFDMSLASAKEVLWYMRTSPANDGYPYFAGDTSETSAVRRAIKQLSAKIKAHQEASLAAFTSDKP